MILFTPSCLFPKKIHRDKLYSYISMTSDQLHERITLLLFIVYGIKFIISLKGIICAALFKNIFFLSPLTRMDEKRIFQVPPPCDNVTSPWIVAWLILLLLLAKHRVKLLCYSRNKNSNKFFSSPSTLVNVLQTLLLIPLKHQMINDFTRQTRVREILGLNTYFFLQMWKKLFSTSSFYSFREKIWLVVYKHFEKI